MNAISADDQRILEQLRSEFLLEGQETIAGIEELLSDLEAGVGDPKTAMLEIRRKCHNLKGQGASFGFPAISVIAHRMEDYLAGCDNFSAGVSKETYIFLDWIERILKSGADPDENESLRIFRRLPATFGAQSRTEQDSLDLEALVMVPSSTINTIMRTRLEDGGFRVIGSQSSAEGLILATRMMPDLVITSVVMDGLSGVDLACALHAMPKTAHIPVMVLSSLPAGHRDLAAIPPDFPIIPYSDVGSEEFITVVRAMAENCARKRAERRR